jgi:HK97 family phage major capsid protein
MNPLAYSIVDRTDIVVQRLDQIQAQTGQVVFYVWKRFGGQVVAPEAMARLITA